jgi:hypothetical protein
MVHHPLKARVPKSLQVQEEQSRHQQGQQNRKPQRLPRKARRRSARNVAPHPSRNSEVWKVLSSAIVTLMLLSLGRTGANAC